MRTCPYCGEEANTESALCEACGKTLDTGSFRRGEVTGVRIDPKKLSQDEADDDDDVTSGEWARAEDETWGQAAPPGTAAGTEAEAAREDPDTPAEAVAEAVAAEQEPEERLSAERSTQVPHSVPRPPVLASEALQRDMLPTEPGSRSMRWLAIGFGILGAISTFALLGAGIQALPLAGAFLLIAALGLAPLPYAARAAGVALVAVCLLVVASWASSRGQGASVAVVTWGTVVLASGLIFRGWHRASGLARLIVLAGIGAGVVWLAMTDAFASFMVLGAVWQSWLPAVLRLPFALLLMLSLLAFMDARSTGGCTAWAVAALFWYGAYVVVQLLSSYWPPSMRELPWHRIDMELAATRIASIFLVALVAFGLAQLLVINARQRET